MRINLRLIATTTLVLALCGIAGCGTTKPSRFYSLTPVPESLTARPTEGPSIGVGPIRLPGYLDRTQIVRHTGGNEFELDEFNRWIEPLKDNVARVLESNLSTMIPTAAVHSFPWRQATPIDFQVIINIIRFHPDQNNNVLLTANWMLVDGQGATVVPTRLTAKSVQAPDAEYASLTAAMSEALAELSREISDAIKAQT